MSEEDTRNTPVDDVDSKDLKPLSEMTFDELQQKRYEIIYESDQSDKLPPKWARLQVPLLQTVTAYKNLKTLALKGKTHTESTTVDGSTVFTLKEFDDELRDRKLPDYGRFLKPHTQPAMVHAGSGKTDVELREDIARLEAEVDARASSRAAAESEDFRLFCDVLDEYKSARTDWFYWLKDTVQKTDGGFTPTMVALAAAGRGGLGATVSKDWKGNLTVDP